MRVMVIGKATKESEAGVMPKQKALEDMGKFNEELVKAGVMLAFGGLQPTSEGKRVRLSGDQRTVIDGPFTESKELIAGYPAVVYPYGILVDEKGQVAGHGHLTALLEKFGGEALTGQRVKGIKKE